MSRRDTDPNRGNRRIPLSTVSAADLLGLNDDEPAAPDRPEPSDTELAWAASCGCRFIGPAGTRAVKLLGRCAQHTKGAKRPEPGDTDRQTAELWARLNIGGVDHHEGTETVDYEAAVTRVASAYAALISKYEALVTQLCAAMDAGDDRRPLEAALADAREQGYRAGKAEGEALRTAVAALPDKWLMHAKLTADDDDRSARAWWDASWVLRAVLDQHGGQR